MQEKIHSLLSGYYMGILSESELAELRYHLEANPSDEGIAEDYSLIWEKSRPTFPPDPIDTGRALIQTKRKIIFRKMNLFQFLKQAAAVLLLAVLFSSAYIYNFHKSNKVIANIQPVIKQEISSMYGTRSRFQLPDGTKVYLNSGSKLIFPTEFKGNERKVELFGEAFFEVAPNPVKPFLVETNALAVKALGTSFNLQAYPGCNEISTTLVHGKIILESLLNGKINQLAELKASERAVFKINKNSVHVSLEEDMDKFIGWKDGKLVFFNDPIDEVAEKLGNWYNVKVMIVNKNLKKYRFTATFSDEPIEQVLYLLSKSSPIRYQLKKAVRLSDNSYSKREIIFN